MKKFIFFLSFLFLFLNSVAEENFLIFQLDNFSGGLNTQYAHNILSSNQSTILDNFVLDEDYGLSKRKGIAYVDTLPVSTTTKILGSYVYVKDNGSSYFIVQAGSNVYTTTQLGKSWTLQKSGLSTFSPIRWTTHFNKVWGTNAVDDVMSFDGETLSTYSFIPKGRFIVSAQERLWIASTINEPNHVYFSDLNIDPTTSADWNWADAIRPGLGDGQVIKGLNYDKNIIWVYKDASIYHIYDTAQMRLYTANYGTVSQESINSYQNGTLFLDKKGIYYTAGGNVQLMSNLIRNQVDKLGLISGSENKWTTTSNADFSTGTFVNCYNNLGTVEISSSVKTWTTTADFESSGYSVSRSTAMSNEVKLEQNAGATPAEYQLFDLLTVLSNSSNYEIYEGTLENIIDSNFDTYVILNFNKKQPFKLEFYDTFGTTNKLKKVKVKYELGTVIKQVSTNNKPINLWDLSTSDWLYSASLQENYINIPNTDGTTYILLYLNLGYIKWMSDAVQSTYEMDVPNNFYIDPTYGDKVSHMEWQIRPKETITVTKDVLSDIPQVRATYSQLKATFYPAIKIYEVEAYKMKDATKSFLYYSTGTYTSPIFDSGQTTTQYQFLRPLSHYTGVGYSTGTIVYYSSSSANSNMSSPTERYFLGTASATNTGLDGKRYFQCGADLWTSSITVTPVIYNVTLQYATSGYATYTSKVYDMGPRIVAWSVFATDDEGTVAYQIRGATWNYSISDTSVSWSDIISESDINLSTASRYVEWRGFLNSKTAKIKAVHMVAFEGSASMQNVASINIDDKYYLAHSTWTTYNDKILILNKNNAWERWTDVPVSSFAKFQSKWYACSSTQPVILELFTGTTEKEAKWKSGHLSFGLPDIDKILRYVYLIANPQTGSFCYVDYSVDQSTVTKSNYVDLTGNDRSHRIPISEEVYGKNFYFTIRSTATSCNIQAINSYYTKFKLR